MNEITLVNHGKILDDSGTLENVKSSDTVFVVLERQPPSWKSKAPAVSPVTDEDNRSSGPIKGSVQTSLSGHQEDDPVIELIKELELAISMLERSNEELAQAGPDPDFEQAIQENIAAISRCAGHFVSSGPHQRIATTHLHAPMLGRALSQQARMLTCRHRFTYTT